MTDRLILGRSSLGEVVLDRLAEQPGTTRLLSTEEAYAETIREDGQSAEFVEVLDEATLQRYDGTAVVFVADEDPDRVSTLCKAVRSALPDSYLLAYAGDGTGVGNYSLESVADDVLDRGAEVSSVVARNFGETGERMRQLWWILRDIDELAILTHDNPDPDAIASGVALEQLATHVGCEASVCYYGEITHQENRAFVNLLDLDLVDLSDDDTLERFDGIALVDHSRPGVNDSLSPETVIDIVIDHHPPRAPVDARYVDLRSNVGATSTLLVEYLEHFDIDFDEVVATALLFGIRVDTDEFSREVVPADFEAAATLVPLVDFATLERIESPTLTGQTLDTVASAIRNRTIEGDVLLSCVGELNERDALAQAADRLLMLEGIRTTLVYGVIDDTIYASGRAQGADLDLGETMRDAFEQIGSAGGHADMAGAQITLGVLEAVEEREESLLEIVEAVVANRFLEAMEVDAPHHITGLYGPPGETIDEYLVPAEQRPSGEETAADE